MSITREQVAESFIYDLNTGVFIWRERPSHHFRRPSDAIRFNSTWAGKRAGAHRKDGYIGIRVNHRAFLLHRVIWFLATGQWPSQNVDHINGDTTDNRISNLRLATQAQNAQNSKGQANSKTGVKGVSVYRNGKFVAQIAVDGRVHHLGYFRSIEEAAAAYRDGALRLHGDFACFR